MSLVADCSRCVGLCCVAPAFVASADFAFSKPAGVACRHLRSDARCGIHDRLRPSGFSGCAAYDCFGAGQRVVSLFGHAGRSPEMLRAYEIVRQLHELLWYVADALSRPAAAPVHPPLAAAEAEVEAAVAAGPGPLESTDPATHRATVAPLLRRASALVRGRSQAGTDLAGPEPAGPEPAGTDLAAADLAGADLAAADLAGADLAGADLRGADLVGRDLAGAHLGAADLSTAYLLGADLRGADLRTADLLGADLRGAHLGGADLTGALYLTRTQLGGALGSESTRLPDHLPRPAHWL